MEATSRIRDAWEVLTGRAEAVPHFKSSAVFETTAQFAQSTREARAQLHAAKRALADVQDVTAQTHAGTERAYTALSRIDGIAARALGPGALPSAGRRPVVIQEAVDRVIAELRQRTSNGPAPTGMFGHSSDVAADFTSEVQAIEELVDVAAGNQALIAIARLRVARAMCFQPDLASGVKEACSRLAWADCRLQNMPVLLAQA